MTRTTIRRMSTDELLDAFFSLTNYAFHPSPPLRDREDWEEAIRGRKEVIYLARFENETAAATVAGSAIAQQVRGNVCDASGIWGVVNDPAARRKGYCRRLMASLLSAQRDQGQAFSGLYPVPA